MNYSLALKLKEAGYPMEKCSCEEYIKHNICIHLDCPILEELIEACGDDFRGLIKRGKKWDAGTGMDIIPSNEKMCRYFSAIEAVANLWLVLNKK